MVGLEEKVAWSAATSEVNLSRDREFSVKA